MTNSEQTPLLNDKTYDAFKWLVQIFLPAFGAFYFGLSQWWSLPASEQVVGTTSVLAIFIGALIGISNRSYSQSMAPYDGTVVVTTTEAGAKSYSLEFEGDPYTLDQNDSVRFKIVSNE